MNGSFLVILLGIPGILVATTVHETEKEIRFWLRFCRP